MGVVVGCVYAEGEEGEVRKDVCGDVGSGVVNVIGGMMGIVGWDETTENVGIWTGTFKREEKDEVGSSEERCRTTGYSRSFSVSPSVSATAPSLLVRPSSSTPHLNTADSGTFRLPLFTP